MRFDNFGGNKTKQTKFLGLLPELNTADKRRHDMVYVEKNKARDLGRAKEWSPQERLQSHQTNIPFRSTDTDPNTGKNRCSPTFRYSS